MKEFMHSVWGMVGGMVGLGAGMLAYFALYRVFPEQLGLIALCALAVGGMIGGGWLALYLAAGCAKTQREKAREERTRNPWITALIAGVCVGACLGVVVIVWEIFNVRSAAGRAPAGFSYPVWEAITDYSALVMISCMTAAIPGAMLAQLWGCVQGAPWHKRWWQSLPHFFASALLGATCGLIIGWIVGGAAGAEFEFLVTIPLATGAGFLAALVTTFTLIIPTRNPWRTALIAGAITGVGAGLLGQLVLMLLMLI